MWKDHQMFEDLFVFVEKKQQFYIIHEITKNNLLIIFNT